MDHYSRRKKYFPCLNCLPLCLFILHVFLFPEFVNLYSIRLANVSLEIIHFVKLEKSGNERELRLKILIQMT